MDRQTVLDLINHHSRLQIKHLDSRTDNLKTTDVSTLYLFVGENSIAIQISSVGHFTIIPFRIIKSITPIST